MIVDAQQQNPVLAPPKIAGGGYFFRKLQRRQPVQRGTTRIRDKHDRTCHGQDAKAHESLPPGEPADSLEVRSDGA